MPRVRRLPSIPFGWYYLALDAERGRRLVRDAGDLRAFLDLLRTTLKQSGARLHAGCVIPHDAHLAVQSGELPVSTITRSFCHEYARRFNRKYLESGRLFRSHPRVLLIQHRIWLVPLVHVIHWMPRSRPAAGECWWSSDAAYRGRARREGLITHAVFHILTHGDRRRDVQDNAYRELFDEPPSNGDIHSLARGSATDSRILGDAEFIADVLRATRQRSRVRKKDTGPAEAEVHRAVVATLERFAAMCEERLPRRQADAWKRMATMEHLRSHSRRWPLPLIRAMAASYVMERHIATQVQIAHFFGCHPKTLSARRRRHYDNRLSNLLAQVSPGASRSN